MAINGNETDRTTRAAAATLVVVLLVMASGFSWAETPVDRSAPQEAHFLEASEPLFAFLLGLVNGDSLGVWSGDDIVRFSAAHGRPSKFPLNEIVSVLRRRPDPQESSRWPGGELFAMWELSLIENLDRPMPYSILGYHPGSLRVAGRLIMSELRLGDRSFQIGDQENFQILHLNGIAALRLDTGSVVLDADAIPDALLGGNLDDAWTLGFALARHEDRQVGLAVSVKRDEGAIFGEFDFERDKIMKSGSPLGSHLSKYCRDWFTRRGSSPPPTWQEKR
jgi:hypothetical protein